MKGSLKVEIRRFRLPCCWRQKVDAAAGCSILPLLVADGETPALEYKENG